VDWGWWNHFQYLIFQALLYLRGLTGDWGMAIILVTLAIRSCSCRSHGSRPSRWSNFSGFSRRSKNSKSSIRTTRRSSRRKRSSSTKRTRSTRSAAAFPPAADAGPVRALWCAGSSAAGVHAHLPYSAQQTGTFYWLIPDSSRTPQSMWDLHHPFAVLPYVLLVILFGVSIWLPQALMPGTSNRR